MTDIIGKGGRVIKTSKWTPKTKTFYEKLKKGLKENFGINLDEFITSSDRTPEEDKAVGGSGSGRHTKGEAFDIGINPVIHKYLWNTKEGLDIMEQADFGMYDRTHGTGPHYHLGADVSDDVIKATARRKELVREDADGKKEELFLTPEDIKITSPEYLDPEFVKEQIIQESITPEQKEVRKNNDKLQAKAEKLKNAKAEYNKAKSIGLKDTIAKAKKDYDDAAYDLYVDVSENQRDAKKARRSVVKEELKLYDENSDQYKSKKEELDRLTDDLYVKGYKGNLIEKKPNDFVKGVKNKEHFLDVRNGKNKISTPDQRQIRAATDAAILSGFDVYQKEAPQLTGEIDFEKPEEREKLVQRLEANTEKYNALVPKVQAIADQEQKALEDRIDKQNIDSQKKLQLKEEARINNEASTPISSSKEDKQAEDYFARFTEPEELITPQQFNYDAKNYKKELPFQALGFGALALSGMSDARTESPLRDEEVSQAILQYTADLKRLSEQGLKPEEEAKMKDQLSGAYSAGLNQLVRASGGDRNVVLGNLHTLNNAKMRGITDIGLADIAIKQENFEKYGQAIKEIQAFRTNRDVANHQIKLDDARSKQQAGAALASSGFSSMLEEIQYQKENGPGSANHRMAKTFEVMLTGVDSDLKDPGDGSVPNTPSYNEAAKLENITSYQKFANEYGNAMNLKDKWNSLSAEEKTNIGFYNFRNGTQPKEQPQQSPVNTSFQTDNGLLPQQSFGPKPKFGGGFMDMTWEDFKQS